MPKPIAVMYIPDKDWSYSLNANDLMQALNGWSQKIHFNDCFQEYLWFVFPERDIDTPRFEVFHPKDFTEIQYEELKQMVLDQLKTINMSTELKTIAGRVELPDSKLRASAYEVAELAITSFYAGKKNGPMIQLTLDTTHIQLNKEQVKDLINTLSDWL